jgi:flavodoxin
MNSLVVFESQFGNTEQVAQAIARGLRERGRAQVVAVDEAPAQLADDLDLLVVGGPTHAFSMSRPESRSAARADGADATDTGVREWLQGLPSPLPVPRVVTFSTRQGHSFVTGSAARSAAKALRSHETVAAEAVDFFVAGKHGPLEDGELDRATEWGRHLVSA